MEKWRFNINNLGANSSIWKTIDKKDKTNMTMKRLKTGSVNLSGWLYA